MKTITLYRQDFRETPDAGNFFDGVLSALGMTESERECVETVTIKVEDFAPNA